MGIFVGIFLIVIVVHIFAVIAVNDSSSAGGTRSGRSLLLPLRQRGPNAWINGQRKGQAANFRLGRNRLIIHAVQDDTIEVYDAAVHRFLRSCLMSGVSFNSVEEKDISLADHLADLCYIQKAGFNEAARLMSGLNHFFPEVKDRLPISSRALIS